MPASAPSSGPASAFREDSTESVITNDAKPRDEILQALGGFERPEVTEIRPGRNKFALARQIARLERHIDRCEYVAERLEQNRKGIAYIGNFKDKGHSLDSIVSNGMDRFINSMIDGYGESRSNFRPTTAQKLWLTLKEYPKALFTKHESADTVEVALSLISFIPNTLGRVALLPIDAVYSGLRVLGGDRTIHYHWAVGRIQLASSDPQTRFEILDSAVKGLREKATADKAPLKILKELWELQYGDSPEAMEAARQREQGRALKASRSIVGDIPRSMIGRDPYFDIEDVDPVTLQQLHSALVAQREAILKGESFDATQIDSRLGDVNYKILEIQSSGTRSLAQDLLDDFTREVRGLTDAKDEVLRIPTSG